MLSLTKYLFAILIISATLILAGCKGCNKPEQNEEVNTLIKATTPIFNADNALQDVMKQVSFGPRVPGTNAQKQCAEWMETKLKSVCDTVYKQTTVVKGGDGKKLPCINLIGSINPKAPNRILLLTHWDSRPWADNDVNDVDKPILAADDGGSGVAVLLELAKEIKTKTLPPNTGIDILFTDVEDYGKDQWGESSYCLGTQYWANHPHVAGYKAQFGILLDMVGAHNAQFPMEGFSLEYAPDIVRKVWAAANTAGYSSYFPPINGATITDDHVFVNRIIKIPTVDIINLRTGNSNVFAAHWHTHQDNMDIIDKNTMQAVGETLLQVVYSNSNPI